MTMWEIIVLAIIQGLTEFLPVSSSGHLVVANAIREALGGHAAPDLIEVSIVLHLGTLAAVLVFYRREIAGLLASDRRVIPLLILASIPAAAIGVTIKKGFDGAGLESPLLAGLMFPVTAAGLIWASRRRPGEGVYQQLSIGQAMIIGCLQAVAILPGISRSGATIVAGLGVGLRRDAAAAFAFLLAIPVIAGGGLLEAAEAFQAGGSSTPWGQLALGFVVAMVVGLVALKLLLGWLQAGKLVYFAYYLIPLGAAVTAWQLSGWRTG